MIRTVAGGSSDDMINNPPLLNELPGDRRRMEAQ